MIIDIFKISYALIPRTAKKYTFWIVLLPLLASCSGLKADENNHPNNDAIANSYHNQNEIFRLSDEEILAFRHEAMSGNGAAAYRLARYWEFHRSDTLQALNWYQISAENGYFLGMYALANFLVIYTNPETVNSDAEMRAKFWYKKVADGGPDDISKLSKDALIRLGKK